MNLTGLKRSRKGMGQMLIREEAKKNDACVPKIRRLTKAMNRCSLQIKSIKLSKKKR